MLLAGIAFRQAYQCSAAEAHSRTADLQAVAGDYARGPFLILIITVKPGSAACILFDWIGVGSALPADLVFCLRLPTCLPLLWLCVLQCRFRRCAGAVAYGPSIHPVRFASRRIYPTGIRGSAHRGAQPRAAGKRQAAFTTSCGCFVEIALISWPRKLRFYPTDADAAFAPKTAPIQLRQPARDSSARDPSCACPRSWWKPACWTG